MSIYVAHKKEERKQVRRINLSISSESRFGSTEEEDGEQGARKEARA
jgi:hypothetical protein